MAANSIGPIAPAETRDAELSRRFTITIELLEAIARNRVLLVDLSAEDRARLLQAAGEVYCPEPAERRRLLKAAQRRHKAGRQQRDQNILDESGIRTLRKKPLFTTPSETAPVGLEAHDTNGREVVEPQFCYICKRGYTTIHHFYD